IGRTGRAGRTGEAISFVTPREIPHLRLIEQVTKSKMTRLVPPTNQEAQRGQQQGTAQKIASAIESGDLKGFNETAKNLLDEHESVTVVSAALKLLTKERKNVPVRISSVQPISVKGGRGGGRDGRRRNTGGGKGFYNKRNSDSQGYKRPKGHQSKQKQYRGR